MKIKSCISIQKKLQSVQLSNGSQKCDLEESIINGKGLSIRRLSTI